MPKVDTMPTGRVVDPQTGELEMEWRDWFEELVFGTSDNSIGTILSGQNGIIAGTTPLTDVLIDGRGSLISEQDAQSNNINTAAASGGGFVATPDLNAVWASGTSGTLTTTTITVSISGGTAPYTVTSTYKSGSIAFAENITGSPLGADGDVTINYSIPWASGLNASAIETITVTDNTAAEVTFDVTATALDITGIGGA